jgi:uncharacterized membrane protein YbhN (UPF0104 family)
MTSVQDPSSRSRFKSIVRVAALLAALSFLTALVVSQWQDLRSFQWQFRPLWLLLSFFLLAVAALMELSIWRFLLASLGGRLRWRRAAETWFLSNLMRYIPGNIWQFLGMVELAADDGVSRLTTFASIALHQALSTAVGIVLAALYFALAGQGAFANPFSAKWRDVDAQLAARGQSAPGSDPVRTGAAVVERVGHLQARHRAVLSQYGARDAALLRTGQQVLVPARALNEVQRLLG